MTDHRRLDLMHDLILPTLFFAALGGMTWAVRGCSGFGGVAGCIFAGVTWGAGWWYLAHDPAAEQSRRYASGWIVPALTFGIGLAGARGWMQWPSFFEGRLMTNAARGEFVPIPRGYGFLWLFLAGVPWAGLGACALAWCGSRRRTRLWHWAFRVAFGLGGAALARHLFDAHPHFFLPLYDSLESRYRDLRHNPSLRRLINDCGSAMLHLGVYLGFLLYEVVRRDWKNVVLILTVGLFNGVGWAACQNWKWAAGLWPGSDFNFWRCWESSGGISIGLAYGIAYFLVNRRMSGSERAAIASRKTIEGPNLEWLIVYCGVACLLNWLLAGQLDGWGRIYLGVILLFGVAYCLLYHGIETPAEGDANLQRWGLYVGLLAGLGLSVRNGLKGWFNIYKGNERYWDRVLWHWAGPVLLVLLIGIAAWVLLRPRPRNSRTSAFPHAYWIMWMVLIVQNAIAQLITGPPTRWNEMAFSIYYLLLFAITAVIVVHFQFVKMRGER